ncbi:MAG: hypothetical protein Q7R99_01780 [bacterium]|nr:hypothetical protein [bacterium]
MANVFEFHFNPLEKTTVFDTFCFLPQTFFEKKQGYLYIVSEIKSKEQQSELILNKSAEIIKKYFYQKPVFVSHDPFQLGLNQANDFLSDFQGNLNFAAVAIGPKCNIKVSKTGDIKIILLRKQEAFDIGSNLSAQHVIEGNLQSGDRILMATPEVFQSLQAEKIIEELSLCYEPKFVKQIFKEKKKIVREFSGACLLAFVKKRPIISFLSRF